MNKNSNRKKILFINNNMHIGGVQKSLADLLKELARDPSLSITLVLLYRGGELLKEIPENVKVIEAGGAFRYLGMTKRDMRTIKDVLYRCFLGAFTRLAGRDRLASVFLNRDPGMKGFDIAVSFLHSGRRKTFYGGCNEFLIKCVEAGRKVIFLHCDYESIEADCSFNTSLYEAADLIAACSEGCRESFLRVLPQFGSKTVVVPNCHDYEAIMELAEDDRQTLAEDSLNVLTVGRMGKEKGILRAIRAVGSLDLPAETLRYYVIGDGIEQDAALEEAEKLKLGDRVVLLGEKLNPYGYMKAADILLIPSFSEAAPLVIDEAAFLGTPVLSTRTVSAEEMISKKGIGWVCGNSESGIKDSLKALITDPDLIVSVNNNLMKIKFDNSAALASFYKSILEK